MCVSHVLAQETNVGLNCRKGVRSKFEEEARKREREGGKGERGGRAYDPRLEI